MAIDMPLAVKDRDMYLANDGKAGSCQGVYERTMSGSMVILLTPSAYALKKFRFLWILKRNEAEKIKQMFCIRAKGTRQENFLRG